MTHIVCYSTVFFSLHSWFLPTIFIIELLRNANLKHKKNTPLKNSSVHSMTKINYRNHYFPLYESPNYLFRIPLGWYDVYTILFEYGIMLCYFFSVIEVTELLKFLPNFILFFYLKSGKGKIEEWTGMCI